MWEREADTREMAVGVEWLATRSMGEAFRFDGMFANQSTVCRLRSDQGVKELDAEFGTDQANERSLS